MARQGHSMQAGRSAEEIRRELEDVGSLTETPKFIAPPTKKGYDLINAAWRE